MAYAIFFGKQMKQRINEASQLCDFVIGQENS